MDGADFSAMDFADWRGLFVAKVLESFWGIGYNLFEVFLWRDIMKMLQGATTRVGRTDG